MMAFFYRVWMLLLIACAICAGLAEAHADGASLSVGGEYFRDRYREPSGDLVDWSNYGSVTGSYEYDFNNLFGAVEGRYSQGSDHYKSVSGTVSGATQYEGEARVIGGVSLPFLRGTLKPYAGIGERLFYDQGKNTFTSTGAEGYDRHISQTYLPLGAFLKYNVGNWTITPRGEFDILLSGRVSTHLGEVPGYNDIENRQHGGHGWRGELMVGQQYHYMGWEAGPFVRYWSVQDSDYAAIGVLPNNQVVYGYEPKNDRLQFGAGLRVHFN